MGFRPCPWALPEQQQGAGECKGAKRPELLPCGVSKSLFCPGSHHSTAFPLPGDLNSALGGMGAAPQRPDVSWNFFQATPQKDLDLTGQKMSFFAFHFLHSQILAVFGHTAYLHSSHFQSHQKTSSEFTILCGPQVEMFNFRFLLMLREMAQSSQCSCWGEIKLGRYFLDQTEMSDRDEINFILNKLFLSRHNKGSPEGFAQRRWQCWRYLNLI